METRSLVLSARPEVERLTLARDASTGGIIGDREGVVTFRAGYGMGPFISSGCPVCIAREVYLSQKSSTKAHGTYMRLLFGILGSGFATSGTCHRNFRST